MLMRGDAIAILVVTTLFAVVALATNRVRLRQIATILVAGCVFFTTAGLWVFGARLAFNRLERAGVTVEDGWAAAWSVLGPTMVKPYLFAIAIWTILLVLLALRSGSKVRNA